MVSRRTAKIREAIVSGIFYPESPDDLRQTINDALRSSNSSRGNARTILSPHAGFEYCGLISAAAWSSAANRVPRTVVILAPYHRAEDSFVYIPESTVFQTPLGDIPVESRYIEEFESSGTLFQINDIPHFEEHCIEVQLPFMQVLFPDASLVPILVGKPTSSTILSLAHSLDLVFAEDAESILFVISSNFIGYPIMTDSEQRFNRVIEYISKGDDASLLEEYKSETPDMCGVGCLAAFIRSHLLSGYSWSLRGKGDSSFGRASSSEKVVHYAAGAWEKT